MQAFRLWTARTCYDANPRVKNITNVANCTSKEMSIGQDLGTSLCVYGYDYGVLRIAFFVREENGEGSVYNRGRSSEC